MACHICGDSTGVALTKLPNCDFSVSLCQTCAVSNATGEQYILNRSKLIVKPGFLPSLIAPNMWAINSVHGPGNGFIPGVFQPNRCMIFRVGAPSFLVVFNPIRLSSDKTEPVAALHRLESVTKTKIKYVVSPDALHNLNLKTYSELFPDAKVLYPAGRIDRQVPDLASKPNCSSFKNDSPEIQELKEFCSISRRISCSYKEVT